MSVSGENHEAIKQLRKEGSQLWQDIKVTHKELSEERPVSCPDVADPQHSVDSAKERRLQGEIDAISEQDIQVLSGNSTLLYEILKDDLSKSVRQLEETLMYLQAEHNQCDEDIAREREYHAQHGMVQKALEKKLQDLGNQQEQSETMILKQYAERQERATDHHKLLMGKLAAFVEEHFPVPDDSSNKRMRRSSGPSARDTSKVGFYRPMLRILEDLLNKCFDSPHDPYLDVTEEMWPPYIELLQRHNLVTRHPDVDTKIKLVPFHL